MDEIVKKLLESRRYSVAVKYAKSFSDKIKRVENLEAILQKCIIKGELEDALKILELLNRAFTTDEMFNLVDNCMKKDSINTGLKCAKLLPEPARSIKISSILQVCIERYYLKSAKEAAEALGRKLSDYECLYFFRKHVEDGFFVNEEDRDLLPQKSQVIELEKALKQYTNRGLFSQAEGIIKLLKRSFTKTELKILLQKSIDEGNYSYAKSFSKKLGRALSKAKLIIILKKDAKRKNFDFSVEIAKDNLLPDSVLLRKNLELALKKEIENGNLSDFQDIAKLLGRKLTVPELSSFLQNTALYDCYEDPLRKALDLIPESHRVSELSKVLEFLVKNDELSRAEKVAELL